MPVCSDQQTYVRKCYFLCVHLEGVDRPTPDFAAFISVKRGRQWIQRDRETRFSSVLPHPMLSNSSRIRTTAAYKTQKARTERAKLLFFHREIWKFVRSCCRCCRGCVSYLFLRRLHPQPWKHSEWYYFLRKFEKKQYLFQQLQVIAWSKFLQVLGLHLAVHVAVSRKPTIKCRPLGWKRDYFISNWAFVIAKR